MEKSILIGTANPSKYPYLCGFFDGTGIRCISPASLGLAKFEAAENGRTARENAIEKAASWYRAAKMPVFALDAGLVFLDLPADHPDQPGVHVRRAAGHTMDDAEMLAWFAAVAHRHGRRLRAAWQDSYCLMREPSNYHTFTFDREMLEPNAFLIVDTPCALNLPGWPVNSISVDIATGKYWGDMTAEERARSEKAGMDKTLIRRRLAEWIRTTANGMFETTQTAAI